MNAAAKAKTTAVIGDLIDLMQKVEALPDAGYVQFFPDAKLFVCSSHAGSLLQASVITDDELKACADHGIGLPAYKNGKGEKSRLIKMKDAKAFELENLKEGILMLESLVGGIGQQVNVTEAPARVSPRRWGKGGQTV